MNSAPRALCSSQHTLFPVARKVSIWERASQAKPRSPTRKHPTRRQVFDIMIAHAGCNAAAIKPGAASVPGQHPRRCAVELGMHSPLHNTLLPVGRPVGLQAALWTAVQLPGRERCPKAIHAALADGASPTAADTRGGGLTALHMAAQSNPDVDAVVAAIDTLLAGGAEVNCGVASSSATPLVSRWLGHTGVNSIRWPPCCPGGGQAGSSWGMVAHQVCCSCHLHIAPHLLHGLKCSLRRVLANSPACDSLRARSTTLPQTPTHPQHWRR